MRFRVVFFGGFGLHVMMAIFFIALLFVFLLVMFFLTSHFLCFFFRFFFYFLVKLWPACQCIGFGASLRFFMLCFDKPSGERRKFFLAHTRRAAAQWFGGDFLQMLLYMNTLGIRFHLLSDVAFDALFAGACFRGGFVIG